MCVLYAEKAIDAFLIDEFNVFEQRCAYLINNPTNHSAFFQKAKNTIRQNASLPDATKQRVTSERELQNAFDIAAFIEQGELYATPEDYSVLFGKRFNQLNVAEISTYAQPLTLEKMGGRVCLASFYGVYTLNNLEELLQCLLEKAACSTADVSKQNRNVRFLAK